jgi:hypothetical protein
VKPGALGADILDLRAVAADNMSSPPSDPDQPTADGPLALSWSGGKDSALTLWTLRGKDTEPEALITTVTDEYDRISMHGVRRIG